MPMFEHIKNNKWKVYGTELTEEYINKITIPTLLDSLKWSPSLVLSQLEASEFPFTRHPKLIQCITEREQAKAQAERERKAHEERMRNMYPDPAEIKRRRLAREENARKIREHGNQLRAARNGGSSDRTFVGGGVVAAGEWDNDF